MVARRCFSAEEMAGSAPTMQRRVTKFGDLTATRKTLGGFRVLASFREALSLLHRYWLTAASSLQWGWILLTAMDLRCFMRSVPTARVMSRRADFFGLLG